MMNIEYFNPEIAKSIGIIEATFLQILYRIIQIIKRCVLLNTMLDGFPAR